MCTGKFLSASEVRTSRIDSFLKSFAPVYTCVKESYFCIETSALNFMVAW